MTNRRNSWDTQFMCVDFEFVLARDFCRPLLAISESTSSKMYLVDRVVQLR